MTAKDDNLIEGIEYAGHLGYAQYLDYRGHEIPAALNKYDPYDIAIALETTKIISEKKEMKQ